VVSKEIFYASVPPAYVASVKKRRVGSGIDDFLFVILKYCVPCACGRQRKF